MTAEATVAFSEEIAPRLRRRHVAAVVAGNALEFYDFLTYAIFAVYIGRAFFPSGNPASSLLLTLATFGAGFITRPIGGLVIGGMADRIGRRPAMVLSFSLMGLAIIGLGLTPSYASIGVAAPIIVLCLRLLQGFALGGEVGPTTAYLIEAAPAEQRGFYGSLQAATQNIAILCAGTVGSVLAAFMSAQELQDWGWRIAFLLGAAVIPFGLAVQRSLPETVAPAHAKPGERAKIGNHLRVAFLGILMLASATIATYVTLYISTYALVTLHMSARAATAATATIGICGACAAVISGKLSDRFGRKPIIILFGIFLLLAVVPVFAVIHNFREPWVLCAGAGFLSTLLALNASPVIVTITELLPQQIRAGGLGTIYALSIAVFGGSAQFNVAWLTQHTGNPIAPAWYMAAGLVLGLIAVASLEESVPVRRHTE